MKQRRVLKSLQAELAQAVSDRREALAGCAQTDDTLVRSVLTHRAERAERRAIQLDRAIRRVAA